MSPDSLVGNPMLTVSECLRRIMAMAITTQQGVHCSPPWIFLGHGVCKGWRRLTTLVGSEAPFFKPHNMKFHQYKTWESIPKKEMPCSFKTSGLQCQKQIQAYLLFAYQVRKRNSYVFSPLCFCICCQVRLTITVRPINCTMMKSCTHDIANGCFLAKSRLTENPLRPHSTKINSKKT